MKKYIDIVLCMNHMLKYIELNYGTAYMDVYKHTSNNFNYWVIYDTFELMKDMNLVDIDDFGGCFVIPKGGGLINKNG